MMEKKGRGLLFKRLSLCVHYPFNVKLITLTTDEPNQKLGTRLLTKTELSQLHVFGRFP